MQSNAPPEVERRAYIRAVAAFSRGAWPPVRAMEFAVQYVDGRHFVAFHSVVLHSPIGTMTALRLRAEGYDAW